MLSGTNDQHQARNLLAIPAVRADRESHARLHHMRALHGRGQGFPRVLTTCQYQAAITTDDHRLAAKRHLAAGTHTVAAEQVDLTCSAASVLAGVLVVDLTLRIGI